MVHAFFLRLQLCITVELLLRLETVYGIIVLGSCIWG